MGRACSNHGRVEDCTQGFDGKGKRKRSLGRPRHRWKGNIKMDLKNIGWGGMDWIHMGQNGD
jgi:hypothetical protein